MPLLSWVCNRSMCAAVMRMLRCTGSGRGLDGGLHRLGELVCGIMAVERSRMKVTYTMPCRLVAPLGVRQAKKIGHRTTILYKTQIVIYGDA
jgi:hypothetical protein